jgi:serine/threonine protein kinase
MNHEKLGRYQLLRLLGQGAMGRIYEAHDPNLDRRVAIKTIHVENLSREEAAEYERRFRTEGRSIARLQHPNIVSVYDCDRDGDTAFLVMEFVQGQDLKERLDAGSQYTLAQIAQLMGDLLAALDYAHRQNIVHRDIKPANLLIESDGRLKLTDFGIARIEDAEDATRTRGAMLGTLKYMSPEQVQGLPTDARSDLYSCGIVLYQLLTGVRPFDGGTDFELIQKIVTQAPPPPSFIWPVLPPAVDALLARALEKSPAARFPDAAAMLTALQTTWAAFSADQLAMAPSERPAQTVADAQTQALTTPPTLTWPAPTPPQSTLPTRSKWLRWPQRWALAALVASLSTIFLLGYLLLRTDNELNTVARSTPSATAANKALVPAPPEAVKPVEPKPVAAPPKLCEKRSRFTYPFCMSYECVKSENTKHPACVRWRAENERLNNRP